VLIEQAKGVLAERRAVNPDEAFSLLREHARGHQQRLADLANTVIDGTAPAELLGVTAPPAP
jgi:AmiR/NasT family two-component response regulator